MWKITSNCVNAIILLISVIVFCRIVLNKKIKIKKSKLIIAFLITCIIQGLIFIYLNGTIKTFLIFISNITFCKYIFKIYMSKSIFLIFMYMILLIVPDVLVTVILTKVLNLSNFYYNEFASSIISNLLVVILYIPLIYLLKKILQRLVNIKIEDNTRIVLYYILTFICVSFFFYKAFWKLEFNISFMVSLFIIVAFLVILFSLIKQTLNNNKIKEEYDKLLEFMTTYENEIEKQRILRHETKNEFLAIRAKLCDNQENKEIVGYIDEILKDKIKVKQEAYAKFGYLPANGIKGLCYFKAQVAEEKGIQVSLNISKKIKDSSIYKLSTKEQREFGRILGVILDNAIEASYNSKEKQIGIEAYTTSDDNCQIIISNTFDGEIDKNKIGKERFSTKGKSRGHGLLLVKHIINENKIFELNTIV